ncbi:Ig-like domain-containing protein [Runella zeae]|uniref:Ig-like domain-containing protein n=1 Tax=Runella zeae TaxID=94255 RepID=UPI0003FD7863|nr:Ig-like domain-containing protein [Runella zeae]
MKKIFARTFICMIGILLGVNVITMAQLSSNTVKYKITYDASTQTYTAWVIPDYGVPNTNNAGTTEKGGTAQYTIVVPKDFVITQITDIKGTWTKTTDSDFRKLGPGNAGQTWPASLDATLNYYVIGKAPSETDYGTFSAGTPVALFSFKGNGCYGSVKPLPPGDAFIEAADTRYSLNVANSFYSRSGQSAGGNVVPREQFINILGPAAECTRIIYAYDDNGVTVKNMPVSENVLINDDKATGTAPLTVSTTLVQQPTSGTVTLTTAGGYTYTPNNNFTGTDTFKYRVCDSGTPSVCDTATVLITVRDPLATNNLPVALSDNAATKAGVPVSGNVLTNDTDPDPGQTLTASIVSNPMHGTVVLNPNGTYTYTPTAGYVGDDKFTYRVCDSGTPSLCTTATVDLNIYATEALNLPPVANSDVFTRTPTGPATGNVLINDIDPEGGTLIINTTPIVGPTNGTVVINPNGTFTYNPNPGYTGPDQFVYEICDNYTPKVCSQAVVFIIPQVVTTSNADLRVTKTLTGNKVRTLNESLIYTVVVRNLGPDAATNIVVKDSVGAGLELLIGTPNKGTFSNPLWNIPSLAAGDSAILTITAKVIAEGVSFNHARIVQSSTNDPVKNNNEASTCVTVPLKLCIGEKVEASVPTNYTNVIWYKNGQQVATGNVVLLSEIGSYTYTATNANCPASGCCPLVIESASNCCPVQLCVPLTVKKLKK